MPWHASSLFAYRCVLSPSQPAPDAWQVAWQQGGRAAGTPCLGPWLQAGRWHDSREGRGSRQADKQAAWQQGGGLAAAGPAPGATSGGVAPAPHDRYGALPWDSLAAHPSIPMHDLLLEGVCHECWPHALPGHAWGPCGWLGRIADVPQYSRLRQGGRCGLELCLRLMRGVRSHHCLWWLVGRLWVGKTGYEPREGSALMHIPAFVHDLEHFCPNSNALPHILHRVEQAQLTAVSNMASGTTGGCGGTGNGLPNCWASLRFGCNRDCFG